ncbi:hypothetical protein CEXT_598461 [Caerostris extrusa]|uniref:Uncharacterized protein n=1 Tax=Caerostris extrusa TaxID=172846 RepID=A0AAV4RAN9_CAEEX|nr:hypothetical protein CEXT_598461 [Caerostris extrusa]
MQNERSNWKPSPKIRKLSVVSLTVTIVAKKKEKNINPILLCPESRRDPAPISGEILAIMLLKMCQSRGPSPHPQGC